MMLDRLSFRWLLFMLASLQPEAESFLLEARARPVVSRTTGTHRSYPHTPDRLRCCPRVAKHSVL
jgi:hypothetical protein